MTTSDYPGRGKANYALVILLSAYILSFVDRQILSLLVEPIKHDLQISDFQISLLQGAAFAIFYVLLGLPLGRLADRKNRKKLIAMGVFAWSVMTMFCGLARTYNILFLARIGVGVGEAALSPATYSILSDIFPPKKLARATAIFTMGITIGGGMAYLLGGSIIELASSEYTLNLPLLGNLKPWQLTFFMVGAPGVLVALLVLTITEPARRGRRISNSENSGESLRDTLRFMAQRHRNYAPIIGGVSLLSILSYGVLNWYPTFLIRTYDISLAEVGIKFGVIYLVFGTLGAFSGALLSEYLMKSGYQDANPRTVMLVALALIPIAIAAPLMSSALWAFLLSIPLVVLLNAFFAASMAALQLITPNQMRALMAAIFLFVTNLLGLGIGSSLVAFFTDFVYGNPQALRYSLVTVAVFTCPVAALIIWRGLPYYRDMLKESEEWGSRAENSAENPLRRSTQ